MAEIIPAIIAKNIEELNQKIHQVEPFVGAVQLDVMDGIFVPAKTWPYADLSGVAVSRPEDLAGIGTNLFLEAHLMVENPHRVLNEWLASPVKRIILHWEAMEKIHNHEILPYQTQVGPQFPVSNLAQEVKRHNKQFGIALNLETPVSVLDHFANEIDLVLLMSVKPGAAGQKFEEAVIPKIAQLRGKFPNVKIEVDGGISPENAPSLEEAGADLLAAGSYIFENDPGEAIKKLKFK